MNKKLIALIFTVFFSYSKLAAEEKAMLGKHWYYQIFGDYQKGKFDNFLQEIHKAYIEEDLPSPDELFSHPESLEVFKKYLEDSKNPSQEINILQELQDSRNESLLKIAKTYPRDFVSVLLRELLQNSKEERTDDFKKIIYLLLQKKNEENYPIDDFKEIIRQFFNKYQIVTLAFAQHNKSGMECETIDLSDEKKYLVVLTLDLIKRVPYLNIPTSEKNELSAFFRRFVQKRIEAHDWDYIKGLADGTIFPVNKAEAEVAKIERIYQVNRSKLVKK